MSFETAATVVRVRDRDCVAVLLADHKAGNVLKVGETQIALRGDISKGHKVALRTIEAGQEVYKYGCVIGRASQRIMAGEHVHTHNLTTTLAGAQAYGYSPKPIGEGGAYPGKFMGYRRPDGGVGIRNEIWILCTVGCVARTAERLAKQANERFKGRVDGIFAFTHPLGCSQLGGDLSRTRDLLAALAMHPNAGGILVVGLGCENNQILALINKIDRPADRIKYFSAQLVEDEHQTGFAALEDLVEAMGADQRVECALQDLVIGVKCGGSDSFSGLTANPLVGEIADRVAFSGGTVIMSEIPEIFGAEQLLMDRSADQQVFDSLVALVNSFKDYFTSHNQPVFENPSPGNKAGGITTLEEKSLGAVQKGGRSSLNAILSYAERAQVKGLNLLEAPGNDAVSSTALAAAGAVIVLFTTGRGTPLGFPAPTLKIASNSMLARQKLHWIDYDAGQALSGVSMDACADGLMTLLLQTASGQPCRNEVNDEREIAIWKNGVTL